MSSTQPANLESRHGKILLAEDDAELRSLIAFTLGEAGYEVEVVGDGDALIDRLAEASCDGADPAGYDLILSDVRMPYFSALDVLLGARRFIGDTPVVLMTAFGDAGTHERARRWGASVVLDKPVRLTELRTTIDDVLSQARRARL